MSWCSGFAPKVVFLLFSDQLVWTEKKAARCIKIRRSHRFWRRRKLTFMQALVALISLLKPMIYRSLYHCSMSVDFVEFHSYCTDDKDYFKTWVFEVAIVGTWSCFWACILLQNFEALWVEFQKPQNWNLIFF